MPNILLAEDETAIADTVSMVEPVNIYSRADRATEYGLLFVALTFVGFYRSAVLQSVARGIGFSTMLALLYGALYGLLISEDNALVLGAGLLFVILVVVMVVTRRIDWYRVGTSGTSM